METENKLNRQLYLCMHRHGKLILQNGFDRDNPHPMDKHFIEEIKKLFN